MSENKKENKKERNPIASYSLRAVAGVYLLYLVYTMIEDLGKAEGNDKLLLIGFMLLFSISGVGILITAFLSWIKSTKEPKVDTSNDEISEEDSDNLK